MTDSLPTPASRRCSPLRALPLLLGGLLATPGLAAPQRPQIAEIEADADWVARDARVGFDHSTAVAARQDVQDLEPGDYGRSFALVALGASGSFKGRPVLLTEATEGELPAERAAAALGLGELGAERVGEGLDLLISLASGPDPIVSQAAMVALVRLGTPKARRAVADRASSGDSRVAKAAQQILAHHVDPSRAEVPPAFERFYGLRWDAARNYGVIDGKVWSHALTQELGQSKLFLEALVLRLVTELNLEGAKDHMLEILLDQEGLTRIDAAIKLMPAEVELLIESGVWRPQDRKEWRWLVSTILHEELVGFFPRSLAASLQFQFPHVRVSASGLLYRVDSRFEDVLIDAFEGEDASLRAEAAYVAGASEIVDFVGRLRDLLDDEDSWVAANAMGALIRMGSPHAATRAVELLATPVEDRPPLKAAFLFEVLARSAPDPEVLAFLDEIHLSLEGPDRAIADSILLISGRPVDTTALREELPLLNPLTVQAFRGAQALGTSPNARDLRLLARLFPRERAPDINLELATALALQGHRGPEPLLRSAVWILPFDQSILACGVVARTYGLATLITWVADPPPGASSEDVRRVGYAIGSFGGERAIEKLQRALGTTAGAELPALQGAILGAYAARTR